MKIVTIANSKGGVGKSTLTSNLIGQSIAMNFKTLYLDIDKQKSLTRWVKKSKQSITRFEGKNYNNKEIKKYKEYSYLFIDSPASIKNKTLDEVIKISDVIIIPISVSSIDEIATKIFIKRIRQYKRTRKIKIFLVLNKLRFSKDNDALLNNYEKNFDEHFVTWIPQTKSFDEQMNLGLTITSSRYANKKYIRDQLIKILNSC